MASQAPSRGSTISRFLPHLIYDATSLALTAGTHSKSGQCPGRLEARSEACSALSLKPKQDYLISLRVSSTLIYRIGILTCLCNEEEEEEKKLLGLRSWTRIQVY